MSTLNTSPRLVDEIADLVASQPSRETLLSFRPSQSVQIRATELLDVQRARSLNADEQQELDQFVHAELLMRLVKARLRAEEE